LIQPPRNPLVSPIFLNLPQSFDFSPDGSFPLTNSPRLATQLDELG
jgi:hypothetical protein